MYFFLSNFLRPVSHSEGSLAEFVFSQKNFYISPEIFILYFVPCVASGYVVARRIRFLIDKFICCVLYTRARQLNIAAQAMMQEYYDFTSATRVSLDNILAARNVERNGSIWVSDDGDTGAILGTRERPRRFPVRFAARIKYSMYNLGHRKNSRLCAYK